MIISTHRRKNDFVLPNVNKFVTVQLNTNINCGDCDARICAGECDAGTDLRIPQTNVPETANG